MSIFWWAKIGPAEPPLCLFKSVHYPPALKPRVSKMRSKNIYHEIETMTYKHTLCGAHYNLHGEKYEIIKWSRTTFGTTASWNTTLEGGRSCNKYGIRIGFFAQRLKFSRLTFTIFSFYSLHFTLNVCLYANDTQATRKPSGAKIGFARKMRISSKNGVLISMRAFLEP